MNRIAAYVRVSSGRQREKMTIETQRSTIAGYAKDGGIEAPQEFCDDGVSSRVPFESRPGSSALLKAARSGKVDKLVVYSLDRLGRDYDKPDTQVAVCHLWAAGVKTIVSLKQGEIHNDKSGRLLLPILCGVAGYERATTLERTDDAKWRIARTGNAWLGGPAPFGYKIAGKAADAQLVIDESQAKWVKRIFAWAVDGWGCRTIAKELNTRGVLPPRAARTKNDDKRAKPVEWWPEPVKRILANSLYYGEQQWGRKKIIWNEKGEPHFEKRAEHEWVSRSCPAIVSKQIFDRVQAVLGRADAASRAHSKRDYLLSGLIRCGCCGKAFTGVATQYSSRERDETGNVKERRYYKCTAKFGKHGFERERCDCPTIRAEELEKRIWEHIALFLAKPASATVELAAKVAAEGSKDRTVGGEIQELEKELAKTVEGRKMILKQAGRGDFTEDEIAAAIRENRERTADIQGRLEPLRQAKTDQKKRQLDLDWAGRLLSELREKLVTGKLDFAKKREFVQTLVEGITVQKGAEGRAQVHVRFRFDRDAANSRGLNRGGGRLSELGKAEKLEARQSADTEVLARR